MSARQATITRDTRETQISVALNLDGSGKASFEKTAWAVSVMTGRPHPKARAPRKNRSEA